MDEMSIEITEQSKALFVAYVEDAGNWGGVPLVGGNVINVSEQVDKGNLTHLKKLGLIETSLDDEDNTSWIIFTAAGKEYAATLGYDESYFE